MKANQNSELKAVVAEVSEALTRLDADRLEELARWCDSLIGDLPPESGDELTRQSREAARDMMILARVLDATRANVAVMKRLRELRAGDLEYREQALQGDQTGYRDGLD